MNPNYATVVERDLDKLLNVGFIALVEEPSWLSPIVVVPKKICVDFRQLNATTKKDPYPSPFTKEVLDEVVGHEVYLFFDGFFNYHQIMIALKNRYKTTFITNYGTFVWVVMPFGLKNAPPTYQRAVNITFKDCLGVFVKLFLDDFNMFSDLDTHLPKLQLCFDKCRKFGISLNPKKCMFFMHSCVILGYVVSKEGKLLDSKKISTIVHMPTQKTPKDIHVFNGMAQSYMCFIKKIPQVIVKDRSF